MQGMVCFDTVRTLRAEQHMGSLIRMHFALIKCYKCGKKLHAHICQFTQAQILDPSVSSYNTLQMLAVLTSLIMKVTKPVKLILKNEKPTTECSYMWKSVLLEWRARKNAI